MTATKEAIARLAGGRAAPRLDVRQCELFLLHEARLLDEGKFDDWLALFTPDACY
jgi:3-phenylpropionate/cinnamic acid dioxygenase small subunit